MSLLELATPSWLWVISIPFWFALYVNPWFRLDDGAVLLLAGAKAGEVEIVIPQNRLAPAAGSSGTSIAERGLTN